MSSSTTMPVRRNGASPSSTSKPPPTASSATTTTAPHSSSSSSSSAPSPYLPTLHERLLLASYPGLLVLGSVFSTLSLPARLAPYSPSTQSHPAAAAPSYFALKRNVFNVFFVKVGWFWISVAFAAFWALHRSMGPSAAGGAGGFSLTPRRARAALRWAAVTGWWMLVTRWAVGPGLIDRVFGATGGRCVPVAGVGPAGWHLGAVDTGVACRLAGGRWIGGLDISGHVFLLVLGSAFLVLEVLPALLGGWGRRERRLVVAADGTFKSAGVEAQATVVGPPAADEERRGPSGMAVTFAMGVVGLCLWMLLMTAVYFHTWVEKFMGLVVALVGVWVVYFLPRLSPAVREIVGLPGV